MEWGQEDFNCYIKEIEDCVEIDRDLMGINRAVWYDINLSLPSAAKPKHEAERESEVCRFFPKFDEALAGAGGEKWTEDSNVIWLRRALSEALKDELIPIQSDNDDYYESVRAIENTAYRFEQSRHFKGSREQDQASGYLVPESNSLSQPRTDADGDHVMNPINSHSPFMPNRQTQGKGSSNIRA
ncbi:hypothetical protein K3495_g1280 [Podosphaera aphanis]|nr:hypothetical protein K3495_g1280 [Podosphaera aphanis]